MLKIVLKLAEAPYALETVFVFEVHLPSVLFIYFSKRDIFIRFSQNILAQCWKWDTRSTSQIESYYGNLQNQFSRKHSLHLVSDLQH